LLQQAPHDSLFSTELVITMVEHFWDYYYKAIIIRCFIPYVIYFSCTIMYMSFYVV